MVPFTSLASALALALAFLLTTDAATVSPALHQSSSTPASFCEESVYVVTMGCACYVNTQQNLNIPQLEASVCPQVEEQLNENDIGELCTPFSYTNGTMDLDMLGEALTEVEQCLTNPSTRISSDPLQYPDSPFHDPRIAFSEVTAEDVNMKAVSRMGVLNRIGRVRLRYTSVQISSCWSSIQTVTITIINVTPTRISVIVIVITIIDCNFCVSDGIDEPHMHGFDGSSFDFQGANGKCYVIHGRRNSERLTARMRSKMGSQGAGGILKSYFDGFGLTTPAGEKVAMSLVDGTGSSWVMLVTVNGQQISARKELAGGVHVMWDRDNAVAEIATPQTKYRISGRMLDSEPHRHLNLFVNVVGTPADGGDYVGVLGFTMNKQEGFHIVPELDVQGQTAAELEMNMRNIFHVPSIFAEETSEMTGIVSL